MVPHPDANTIQIESYTMAGTGEYFTDIVSRSIDFRLATNC